MSSYLWQRLRAARKSAEKRQADIAVACGVTRSAVAQWESADADIRTVPSTEHVQRYAKACGVPIQWLLSDDGPRGRAPTQTESVIPAGYAIDAFIKATEFAVMETAIAYLSGFGAKINTGFGVLTPGFLLDGVAVEFLLDLDCAARIAGRLLLTEKALYRPLQKIMLHWDRKGAPLPPDMVTGLLETYGIHYQVVASPQEAAAVILSHIPPPKKISSR